MILSRIGKKAIKVPVEVKIKIVGEQVFVNGPKGDLIVDFEQKFVSVVVVDDEIKVSTNLETKEAKARHGLYRSLISNAIDGVMKPYVKELKVIGVGYRFEIQGKNIKFALGFSHDINFAIPDQVKVEISKDQKDVLVLTSIDKQMVGQTAANIRALRPPEPYKGKGVRYVDEYVKIKAGKSVAK